MIRSIFLLTLFPAISLLKAESFLIEAEQFSQKGGWQVDTQFIETMGSPYLLAHGMGKPVADATTEASVARDGNYTVWVRTIDWTERLKRTEGGGLFAVVVNGEVIGKPQGNGAAAWTWEKVGTTALKKGKVPIALRDITGFDGRVDAILFSSDPQFSPPVKNMLDDRMSWKVAGAPKPLEATEEFDLVVVGGGYGGLGAAISAARMGCKVALIQNRMVLGGNGSSEVRVWAMGDTPPSEYALADIVKEIEDDAKTSPAPAARRRRSRCRGPSRAGSGR